MLKSTPMSSLGNTGEKQGWKIFNPQEYGIMPLSVIAVVCREKLVGLKYDFQDKNL